MNTFRVKSALGRQDGPEPAAAVLEEHAELLQAGRGREGEPGHLSAELAPLVSPGNMRS